MEVLSQLYEVANTCHLTTQVFTTIFMIEFVRPLFIVSAGLLTFHQCLKLSLQTYINVKTLRRD